jgi:preprotein translocase subunit YajC
MSTITLYASKINQMPSLINDAKKAVKEYKSDLKSLNLKVLTIDNSICNVDDVISSIKSSTQTQGDKIDALDNLKKDVNEFIADVVRIDGDAADAINKSKDDFYDKYEYLKPECEKSGWEKFKDGCKKVGEWCQEHWKAIITVVIVITAVVILVTCPACGAIIAGACWGAISGAVIGGVAGGLSSLAMGGSFWAGFEEGAFSGAISGAIFGGIGGAGSMLGTMSNSCKLFNVMKWTSRITGVLSGGMGLFDTATMVIGLFDPQNAFVQFNQKLHSSKLYNGFQFTVSALAVFSGSTYNSMKKHQETLTCFVAGTMILTASGLVAIENIKAGDKVISTDPETMETAEKTVLETYIREDSKLIHLVINDEEIITTETHPFYVNNRGFVNAGELKVGDELLDPNKNILLVENFDVELTDEPTTVYNFQVEDFHTYFVGECGVWVHNANYKNSNRKKYVGKTPSKKSRTGNEVISRMEKEGKIRNNKKEFLASDGNWYPIEKADMAHIKDAVVWWNEKGRFYGAKAPEVRAFMLDSNNYYLELYSINRSQGAHLGTYLPPATT